MANSIVDPTLESRDPYLDGIEETEPATRAILRRMNATLDSRVVLGREKILPDGRRVFVGDDGVVRGAWG